MTVEELKKEIIETEDDLLSDMFPADYGKKKTGLRFLTRPAVMIPVLTVLVVLGMLFIPRGSDSLLKGKAVKAETLAKAEYPEMISGETLYKSIQEMSQMSQAEYEALMSQQEKARAAAAARQQKYGGTGGSIRPFLQKVMTQTLSRAGDQNALSAPLSLYFALAMLSETTDGASRQEILDALGAGSQSALRKQAERIWQANYYDDGVVRCVLGNSLWLSNELAYRPDTVRTLADSYFASVFRGEMGSEEYSAALRNWIDQQTGDLLEESTGGLSLTKETVLALVSTVLFQDKWNTKFEADSNTEGVFHSPQGDRTVTYMNRTDYYGTYYYGEKFGACAKACDASGAAVWFILPDEGVSMEELLQDPELQAFLITPRDVPSVQSRVNFSLPKFDITAETDLVQMVRSLGITNVFDPATADFTALTDAQAFVSEICQGARMIVDEEGVKAAAYVMIAVPGSPAPPEEEVDFVLDRPFLFILRSCDNQPLLVGVVNQP